MKVTFVGGGSTYTPVIVKSLIESSCGAVVRKVTLMDTDLARADAMAYLAARACEQARDVCTLDTTTSLERGIADADIVLLQIRAGGFELRHRDESVPLEFRCPGDESIGPGGLAHAIRVIPDVRNVMGAVEAGGRDPWVVVLTNPTGILVRAISKWFPRVKVIGLCDVPFDVGLRIAQLLRVDPRSIAVRAAGVNHGSFVVSVESEKGEMLPDIISRWDAEAEESLGFPRSLVEDLGVIPCLPYMRSYYLKDKVLAEQRSRRTSRAQDVERWQARVFQEARSESPRAADVLKTVLTERQAPLYGEITARVVSALSGSHSETDINLTTLNAGALSGLRSDDIVEVPCHLDSSGCRPARVVQLAGGPADLVHKIVRYESLLVDGLGDIAGRSWVADVLRGSPLIGPSVPVDRLAAAIASYNQVDDKAGSEGCDR